MKLSNDVKVDSVDKLNINARRAFQLLDCDAARVAKNPNYYINPRRYNHIRQALLGSWSREQAPCQYLQAIIRNLGEAPNDYYYALLSQRAESIANGTAQADLAGLYVTSPVCPRCAEGR